MITKADLEKIGIIHSFSKPRSDIFSVPFLGDIDIQHPYDMNYIFKRIYEKGREQGINEGKQMKLFEIQRVLGIDDI